MKNSTAAGHLAALITILIWGTTFISTKVLLKDFHPVEILFFRFLIGFLALWIVHPRPLRGTTGKQEHTFAAAGLCGICIYYLLENIALTYTAASNVGVILSTAPFFTAILSLLCSGRAEKLSPNFLVGFGVAMAGIFLISFHGSRLSLNPKGDLLAFLAALVWACYSLLTRAIGSYGFSTILTTRRIFFYGLLCITPCLFFWDCSWDLQRFFQPYSLGNLLYLGLCASALCFVTWNFAVQTLGAVKTSIYIYLVPVITVSASFLILQEPITWLSGTGTALTFVGLFLSDGSLFQKQQISRQRAPEGKLRN